MDNKFKKILEINGVGYLASEIQSVKKKDIPVFIKGMKMVSENWDCEPHGAVIDDIVNYLKDKLKENSSVPENQIDLIDSIAEIENTTSIPSPPDNRIIKEGKNPPKPKSMR